MGTMIDLIKTLLKSALATSRWGPLTEEDEELVWDSSFAKIFKASSIRRTLSTPHTAITLE